MPINKFSQTAQSRRGLLGIRGLDTVTPDKAPTYGLDKNATGVFFSSVDKDSAAENAGITHKDVILEIDGKPVETYVDLQMRISLLKPGTKVTLTVSRHGQKRKVQVELGKRLPIAQIQAEEEKQTVADKLGFKVEDMNETTARNYGFEGQSGVIVTEVDSLSEARRNGLIQGTLIKEVNNKIVKNVKEFNQALEVAQENKMESVLLWGNIKGTDYNFFIPLP